MKISKLTTIGASSVLVALAATSGCGSDGDGSSIIGEDAGDGGGGEAGNSGSGGDGGSGGGTGGSGAVIGVQDSGNDGPTSDACGENPIRSSTKDVNMLLVIDKSASMNEMLGSSGSRWDAITQALDTSLTAAQDQLSFGLELFPSPDTCNVDSTLAVPVEPGATSVPAILLALAGTTPSGNTPTAAALGVALDYYTNGDGAQLTGDKYVLLATDGGPNCNDSITCMPATCITHIENLCPMAVSNCCATDPESCLDDGDTLGQVQALATAGVGTVVVGLPGSEAYTDTLESLALAGSVVNPDVVNPDAPPSFFAVDALAGVDALAQTFTDITRELITSCELQLEMDPPNPDEVNVKVDGETIPKEGADGWELDESTDPDTIVLKGATCDRVEMEGAESVDVVFGCPTVK